MEEQHPQGVVGADFQFHRHRGIHLESKTYHTLLQIFTHCYGNSPLSSAPPILPPPSPSENNGGSQRISDGDGGGETRLSEELDVSGRREPDDSSGPEGTELDGGVKDAGGGGAIDATKRRIDELEQIMQGEDNGNDSMSDMSREQILMSELQDFMEGSEEWFNDGGSNSHGMVLEIPQGNDGVSGQLNNGEQFADVQRLAEEVSRSPGQAQSKECRLEAAETVVSPLEICGLMNKDEQFVDLKKISEEECRGTGHVQSEKEEYMLGDAGNVIPPSEIGGTAEVLKPSGNSEQVSSTQHKETGSEQPASSNHMLPSTGEMVESHELEDGEISDDDSGYMVLDCATILIEQSNGGKRQLSNDLTNQNWCTPNAEDGSKRRSVESPAIHDVHGTSRSREIEFEESNLNKMVDEGKKVHGKTGSGSEEFLGNLDQIGNKMTEVTSGEKDGNLCKKRKRGPGKEKKRAKDRKKRAKMRRELGLDRVKVKPIMKPKTVSYCRHYLAGRCYEGEKCKFSHDAVPLTKSKPCRFFSRDACMKGDDCPFDHQLSKYPCDNYTNKGFCSRADSCLFSHKMPSEGAPSLSQPEKSDPKSPKSKSVNAKQQQNVLETPQKMVGGEQNCKPLSELSSLRSSIAVASGTVQRKLPPRRTQSRASGVLTNEGALVVSKKVAAPVVAPAGINFLSFSRGPSVVSGGNNFASLIISDGDRSKQLPNKNSVGSQAISAASRDQNSTQIGKESPLAVPPCGLSFLSFGKKLADDAILSGKVGTPSSEKDGHHPERQHASEQQHQLSPIMKTGASVGSSRLSELISHRNAINSTLQTLNSSPLVDGGPEKNKSAQESQHTPDKQFTRTIPLKLPVNPSAAGQSSEQSAHRSLSKFRQDPVMSTLSCASNFNSKPASLPAVASGLGGGGESSTAAESNSVKLSKIKDFLSSIGRKTKH